uniref:SAM domain-containing protein n=1 Tax=Caenorhabditis japonica TaxID=281687 RepID=A0A8R1HR63_CAEJA
MPRTSQGGQQDPASDQSSTSDTPARNGPIQFVINPQQQLSNQGRAINLVPVFDQRGQVLSGTFSRPPNGQGRICATFTAVKNPVILDPATFSRLSASISGPSRSGSSSLEPSEAGSPLAGPSRLNYTSTAFIVKSPTIGNSAPLTENSLDSAPKAIEAEPDRPSAPRSSSASETDTPGSSFVVPQLPRKRKQSRPASVLSPPEPPILKPRQSKLLQEGTDKTSRTGLQEFSDLPAEVQKLVLSKVKSRRTQINFVISKRDSENRNKKSKKRKLGSTPAEALANFKSCQPPANNQYIIAYSPEQMSEHHINKITKDREPWHPEIAIPTHIHESLKDLKVDRFSESGVASTASDSKTRITELLVAAAKARERQSEEKKAKESLQTFSPDQLHICPAFGGGPPPSPEEDEDTNDFQSPVSSRSNFSGKSGVAPLTTSSKDNLGDQAPTSSSLSARESAAPDVSARSPELWTKDSRSPSKSRTAPTSVTPRRSSRTPRSSAGPSSARRSRGVSNDEDEIVGPSSSQRTKRLAGGEECSTQDTDSETTPTLPKKKTRTSEADRLRSMDFGPKDGGSLADIGKNLSLTRRRITRETDTTPVRSTSALRTSSRTSSKKMSPHHKSFEDSEDEELDCDDEEEGEEMDFGSSKMGEPDGDYEPEGKWHTSLSSTPARASSRIRSQPQPSSSNVISDQSPTNKAKQSKPQTADSVSVSKSDPVSDLSPIRARGEGRHVHSMVEKPTEDQEKLKKEVMLKSHKQSQHGSVELNEFGEVIIKDASGEKVDYQKLIPLGKLEKGNDKASHSKDTKKEKSTSTPSSTASTSSSSTPSASIQKDNTQTVGEFILMANFTDKQMEGLFFSYYKKTRFRSPHLPLCDVYVAAKKILEEEMHRRWRKIEYQASLRPSTSHQPQPPNFDLSFLPTLEEMTAKVKQEEDMDRQCREHHEREQLKEHSNANAQLDKMGRKEAKRREKEEYEKKMQTIKNQFPHQQQLPPHQSPPTTSVVESLCQQRTPLKIFTSDYVKSVAQNLNQTSQTNTNNNLVQKRRNLAPIAPRFSDSNQLGTSSGPQVVEIHSDSEDDRETGREKVGPCSPLPQLTAQGEGVSSAVQSASVSPAPLLLPQNNQPMEQRVVSPTISELNDGPPTLGSRPERPPFNLPQFNRTEPLRQAAPHPPRLYTNKNPSSKNPRVQNAEIKVFDLGDGHKLSPLQMSTFATFIAEKMNITPIEATQVILDNPQMIRDPVVMGILMSVLRMDQEQLRLKMSPYARYPPQRASSDFHDVIGRPVTAETQSTSAHVGEDGVGYQKQIIREMKEAGVSTWQELVALKAKGAINPTLLSHQALAILSPTSSIPGHSSAVGKEHNTTAASATSNKTPRKIASPQKQKALDDTAQKAKQTEPMPTSAAHTPNQKPTLNKPPTGVTMEQKPSTSADSVRTPKTETGHESAAPPSKFLSRPAQKPKAASVSNRPATKKPTGHQLSSLDCPGQAQIVKQPPVNVKSSTGPDQNLVKSSKAKDAKSMPSVLTTVPAGVPKREEQTPIADQTQIDEKKLSAYGGSSGSPSSVGARGKESKPPRSLPTAHHGQMPTRPTPPDQLDTRNCELFLPDGKSCDFRTWMNADLLNWLNKFCPVSNFAGLHNICIEEQLDGQFIDDCLNMKDLREELKIPFGHFRKVQLYAAPVWNAYNFMKYSNQLAEYEAGLKRWQEQQTKL